MEPGRHKKVFFVSQTGQFPFREKTFLSPPPHGEKHECMQYISAARPKKEGEKTVGDGMGDGIKNTPSEER